MARSLIDLCNDIIYEAGRPQVRPFRIKSIATEIRRKYGSMTDAQQAPDPAHCEHPGWAQTPMTTGDGTPINFCNLCKCNQLA